MENNKWALWKSVSKNEKDYLGWKIIVDDNQEFRVMVFEFFEDYFPKVILLWKDWQNLKEFTKIEWELRVSKNKWVKYSNFDFEINWKKYHLKWFKNNRYVEWWKIPLFNLVLHEINNKKQESNKETKKETKKIEEDFNDIIWLEEDPI